MSSVATECYNEHLALPEDYVRTTFTRFTTSVEKTSEEYQEVVSHVLSKLPVEWSAAIREKRNRIAIKVVKTGEDVYAVHFVCHIDSILIRLGKSCGFPRGFCCVWVRGEEDISVGAFYPKFENDRRNKRSSDDFEKLIRIAVTRKVSGSTGIVVLNWRNDAISGWHCSSKNSALMNPVGFCYPLANSQVLNKYLTPSALQILQAHGIASIGTEVFHKDDQSHGYGYKESGFVVTSMTRVVAAGEKPVYLGPEELTTLCREAGLPYDAPVVVEGAEAILAFTSGELSTQRNLLLESTLAQKVAAAFADAPSLQFIAGDNTEGFVIRRWKMVDGDGCSSSCVTEEGYECLEHGSACETICGDGLVRGAEECDDGNKLPLDGVEVEIEAVKYKCWPYQMVTQVLRPMLQGTKNALEVDGCLNSLLSEDGTFTAAFVQKVEDALAAWVVTDDPMERAICRWLVYTAASKCLPQGHPALSWSKGTPFPETPVPSGAIPRMPGVGYWISLASFAVGQLSTLMKSVDWDYTQFSRLVDLPLEAHLPQERPTFKKGDKLIFVLVGFPGLGKSLFGRVLAQLLKGGYFTQDDYANNRAFFAALKQAIKTNNFIIADRGNHTLKHRQDVLAQVPGAKVVYVDFVGEDARALMELAETRINARGVNHQKLTTDKGLNIPEILDMFVGQFQPITEEEQRKAVATIRVDPRQTPVVILNQCQQALVEAGIMAKALPDKALEAKLAQSLAVEKSFAKTQVEPVAKAPSVAEPAKTQVERLLP
jgi:cysteine-rich repeat protein